MNEGSSIEAIGRTNLTEQTQIRLDKITEIENYQEINQRKSCSKKLSNFKILMKILIVFSPTTGGVSICSFTSVVGAAVGIASASFTLIFSLTTGIVKKLLNITRKKRKSMIKFLCWLKVNSIASKH